MTLYLLTHQRELKRKTNTGSLVAEVLGDDCEVIVWERVSPNRELLSQIETGSVALLYPSEDSEPLSESVGFESYVILDGTWQEAQKIYNRSPYLKGLKTFKIDSAKPSIYSLRRNQKDAGLCTAESAIEVLKRHGNIQRAKAIELKLLDFLNLSPESIGESF
ncbi:DTW domain-containing protein [Myxococcota bacterium]|nr:DTW domain-containing protein [Myxococcota bacterium]